MSVQHRRKYDPDFKRNAVLLSEENGRTVNEVTESLGVGKDLLYRWKREYRSQEEFAFPGNGAMTFASIVIDDLEDEREIVLGNNPFCGK